MKRKVWSLEQGRTDFLEPLIIYEIGTELAQFEAIDLNFCPLKTMTQVNYFVKVLVVK